MRLAVAALLVVAAAGAARAEGLAPTRMGVNLVFALNQGTLGDRYRSNPRYLEMPGTGTRVVPFPPGFLLEGAGFLQVTDWFGVGIGTSLTWVRLETSSDINVDITTDMVIFDGSARLRWEIGSASRWAIVAQGGGGLATATSAVLPDEDRRSLCWSLGGSLEYHFPAFDLSWGARFVSMGPKGESSSILFLFGVGGGS